MSKVAEKSSSWIQEKCSFAFGITEMTVTWTRVISQY